MNLIPQQEGHAGPGRRSGRSPTVQEARGAMISESTTHCLEDSVKAADNGFKDVTPFSRFEPLSTPILKIKIEQLSTNVELKRHSLPPGRVMLSNDGAESFILLVSRKSRIEISHRGRSFIVGPGSGTIMRSSEPGILSCQCSFSFFSFSFPVEYSLGRQNTVASQTGRLIGKANRVLLFIRDYIRQMELRGGAEDLVRETACRHLIELTGLLAELNSRAGNGCADAATAARVASVRDRIATHAGDPNLSLSLVAKAERVSTRYLQHIIERSGDTFTGMVKRVRLETAWSLLADSAKWNLRIIDIATLAGFSDISHFNRSFREHYGQTPRDVRANAMSACASCRG